MPRSSRHKSNKHSTRDYSDSEDDSSLKERRANEEGNARFPKDSGPSEKRKVDSKDGKELYGSGNGEYLDEYSSSKRRREKVVDGASDRWSGGDEVDERGGDSLKKAKGASESKSRRRDDEIEEMKRSGGKSEKHRETSRKEGRESERRGREAKGEKSGDNEEGRSSKREITIESKAEAAVKSPNSLSENLLEGRSKRRRDDSADWSKYQDDIADGKNRHTSSMEDAAKDVRRKDEKQRDDRYRDRYREEVDRDSKSRVEKKKDDFPAKDRTGSKSTDKYLKDDRDNTEARQKKSKSHDGLREHEIDSARDHDQDRDRDRDREHDQDGYRNRDRVRSGERDRNPARDKERDRDWEHDHDRDRDRDRDRDWEDELAHHDDRSIKYKDRRGRKRSPDDHDDYSDGRLRGSKAHNSDSEKRSLSGSKVEADGRVGSQSRQAHAEITVNSSRHRASPSSSSHGGTDEHRHVRQDDLKYRDLPLESRLKATERASKYRSLEKPSKMDDGHYVELSGERSSSSKASPKGLVERSPSSPSLERRHMHRTGVRRSLDVEEQGRSSRASVDARDVSVGEGRFTRDIPSDKPVLDESSQADSSFYNRPGQRSSSIPPPPFRAGVESPTFMGLEEDGRNNLNARYKRSGDLNLGRGPVNNWRSVPNWSSPVPNGFMPFQHGPPHGNFQGLMPHFPSPLFGVRPPMDINQSGIPYPMADTDRFPGHMRPLGWTNMIDASGPPRLHGWDVNSGALRNEPPIYAGPDWDHSRHPVNSRGWETSVDMWKGHSGGANVDMPSTSHKESIPALFPVNEGSAGQGTQKPNNEDSREVVQEKAAEIKAGVASSEKETSKSTEIAGESKANSSKLSESNKRMNISRFYLSKLDISAELVHSEVYQGCMNILDGELNSTADEDPVTRVILKNHPRLEPKARGGSLSSSLFPAIDDSVFRKAMDLYKKERLETRDIAMSKGGLLDFVLSTTLNEVAEPDQVCHMVEKEEPACPVDEREEPACAVDERTQSPIPAADRMEAKAILSAVGEEPGKDVPEPILVSSSKKPGLVQKGQGDLGEDPIGLSPGEKRDLIHASVNLDDGCADHILSRDLASQAAAVLPIEDSGGELVVKTASDHVSGETGHFANKVGDSLVVDGPSSTQEASMPGSNESHLVNLSRIHHSPESTH